MQFTTRIIAGNAISIILAIASTAIINPKSELWIHFVIGLVLLVVTSLTLGVVSGYAFNPLKEIVEALEKAACGDLSIRTAVRGNGEFARLATAFNSMMEDMNKAMRQFFSVADLVRDSVVMVRGTTDTMACAAEEVAIQAGSIATASVPFG